LPHGSAKVVQYGLGHGLITQQPLYMADEPFLRAFNMDDGPFLRVLTLRKLKSLLP
jgi:hypothetical protein